MDNVLSETTVRFENSFRRILYSFVLAILCVVVPGTVMQNAMVMFDYMILAMVIACILFTAWYMIIRKRVDGDVKAIVAKCDCDSSYDVNYTTLYMFLAKRRSFDIAWGSIMLVFSILTSILIHGNI